MFQKIKNIKTYELLRNNSHDIESLDRESTTEAKLDPYKNSNQTKKIGDRRVSFDQYVAEKMTSNYLNEFGQNVHGTSQLKSSKIKLSDLPYRSSSKPNNDLMTSNYEQYFHKNVIDNTRFKNSNKKSGSSFHETSKTAFIIRNGSPYKQSPSKNNDSIILTHKYSVDSDYKQNKSKHDIFSHTPQIDEHYLDDYDDMNQKSSNIQTINPFDTYVSTMQHLKNSLDSKIQVTQKNKNTCETEIFSKLKEHLQGRVITSATRPKTSNHSRIKSSTEIVIGSSYIDDKKLVFL